MSTSTTPATGTRRSALLLAVQGVGRSAGKNPDAAEQGLSRRIRLVPAGEIHPDPEQPRQTFDDASIARLAETIKTFGILSPIVVTPDPAGQGGYRIVLGERRYRAACVAGLPELPTIQTGALEPKERLELQLLENVGREDLNVVDEGRAYARLAKLGAAQREIALRVGRSEASVSRALAIATKLEAAWLDEAAKDPALQSPSKLYEIAQAPEAERAALFLRLKAGTSRDALATEARQGTRRRPLDAKLAREVEALLAKLRTRFKSQVDGRRLNRRALVELALRRLLDGWDEPTAAAFLKTLA